MRNLIHIALAADSNYILPITVALQSIFAQNPGMELHIYLLFIEQTLNEKDQNYISSFVTGKGGHFHALEVKNSDLNVFPDTRHGKATLLRLYLPEMLPGLHKILYLDGDIVVTDRLDELYHTDIDNYYLAAVKDSTSGYGREYQKRIGINESHWYFNAGVTLLNLDSLRAINLPEKVAHFAKKYYDRIVAPDQDALNYICQERKVYYLHPRYNMNYAVEKDIARHVWGKQSIKEAKEAPAIIHFIGPVKPWSILSVHPCRKYWWRALQQTPFAQYRCKDSCLRNYIRRCFLQITKPVEAQFTVSSKKQIGKLIPSGLKRGIKKSLLKPLQNF